MRRLTRLATDIIFPINNSDIEAKRKAFFNVPLFKDLYEVYGDQPTIDQIKWSLRQKGNAEPAKAEDEAPEIRKIYIESIKEISIAEEREEPVLVKTGLAPSRGVQAMERVRVPEGVIELKDGDVTMWLPPTPEAVEIAKSLIEHFERTRLKTKEEEAKEEKEN